MRVGVLSMLQYSMFSSGMANASLAIAELVKELGHDVDIIQMGDENTRWWDDCSAIAPHWKVVAAKDASGYDLIFEIGQLMMNKETRQRATKASIWVVRNPHLLQEMESSLFPTSMTHKRDFEGLKEVWVFDAAAESEKGSLQVLELLARCPVRTVPFVWTPSIAMTHAKEAGLPRWIQTTLAALKEKGATNPNGPVPGWAVHVAETNNTNASACVLPIVMMREAKRRGFPVDSFRVYNSDNIKKSAFFMDNIVKNSMDDEVGLSGEFLPRQRCLDWLVRPHSCVLSHIRFKPVRPMLLDLAWVGMPTVHNSPLLRDVGHGYDAYYYAGNRIGGASDALQRMHADFLQGKGVFDAGAVEKVQVELMKRFTPFSDKVQGGWREALERIGVPCGEPKRVVGLAAAAPTAAAPTAAAPTAAAPTPALPATFRVGFCDMWENFNPAYNFFTLMLQDSADKAGLPQPLKIIGEYATSESDIVIFGPFGEAWKLLPAEQPKVHFTGENTPQATGPGVKLNLGFRHADMVQDNSYLRFPLWILEIDWFGAQPEKIQNPKPIPLEDCCQVHPETLERKKKFCAFVVSNPNNPVRNAAFHWLNEYKSVDSAGRLFNNVGGDIFAGAGGGGGELLKFEFLKDYKFALTYENSSGYGYTTEKYLHAKAAGCVPIYWGDPAFERDFNVAGCIDARNVKTPAELVELVRKVDEDDEEWKRRFSVPALDPYKVAWCRRTMAECASRMFVMGGLSQDAWPRFIGKEMPGEENPPQSMVRAVKITEPFSEKKEAEAPAPAAKAPEAKAPVAPPASALEIPLLVTYATRQFLPHLQHWLMAVRVQAQALKELKARVYITSDVPDDTFKTLSESFQCATFVRVPDTQPPAGAEQFQDFWAPEHYAWKLWLYNELVRDASIKGKMVLYLDAGAFMCRWPKAWLLKAQEAGVCMLEDRDQENRRWCSPSFVAALGVTEAEMDRQQRQGGLMCFRAGHPFPANFFAQAYEWAKRRDVIAGPKWAGVTPEGKPFGHRHDQSILSIMSVRLGVPALPLYKFYCDHSLRKTFTTGRCIYVHRGNFNMHTRFAEGIDDAFVINLERRGDRMKRLWENHPGLEGRVERWPAVDGRSLALTPALAKLLSPNDFFWKKAVTGCALSHLGLWHKLANETPDIKNYLILEDDVKFVPGWEDAWKKAVKDEHIPTDYDIIYLGGILPPNRHMFHIQCKERINDSICRVAENAVWGQRTPNRYFHFCAYSYILSRSGALKVLQLLHGQGGYWTSADHILCNPVDVIKAYVFDPCLAGCYQDDDPKYANSQFNDFSRIDEFDSDLWNNDERFTGEEIAAALKEWGEADLDIGKALSDVAAAAAAAAAALEPPPPPKPVVNDVIGNTTHETATTQLKKEMGAAEAAPATEAPATEAPATEAPAAKRFVTFAGGEPFDMSGLYEYKWLQELFGRPSMMTADIIRPEAPPPQDTPIVIIQRPHTDLIAAMLEKWDSLGAKFYVLHFSDEYTDEHKEDISFYSLPSCKGVIRFYLRDDIPEEAAKKTITIPLGYHWTVRNNTENPVKKTPQTPFREFTWSFAGTAWGGRMELLKPLLQLDPATTKHKLALFEKWADENMLKEDEYVSTLLNTLFVPCPDGVNAETFRFYEALECGCIPLVVNSQKNAAWSAWVTEKLGLTNLDTWEDAAELVKYMSAHPENMEKYREKILAEWFKWKKEVQLEIKVLLHECD